MTMMSFDGSTKYVWNPFSLKQLQDMLAGGRLDTYMQCVATGGQCTAPSHDIFDNQQVMRIAMLTSLCSVAHAFNVSLPALPSPVFGRLESGVSVTVFTGLASGVETCVRGLNAIKGYCFKYLAFNFICSKSVVSSICSISTVWSSFGSMIIGIFSSSSSTHLSNSASSNFSCSTQSSMPLTCVFLL